MNYIQKDKEYRIGQKVVYQSVICTIIKPKDTCFDYWIYNPEKGYEHGVNNDYIKPFLPTSFVGRLNYHRGAT